MSQASTSSRSSGGCPSSLPSNWLNVGETDEHVYKIKHLKGVHITKLPTDATSCREWRAAFLAAVSRIDLTSCSCQVCGLLHGFRTRPKIP